MKPSVIVWDLETVPDLGGFAAINDLVGIGQRSPDHAIYEYTALKKSGLVT